MAGFGWTTALVFSKMKDQLGVRGYLHSGNSLGYYLNGGQEFGGCLTIFGRPRELLQALMCVKKMTAKAPGTDAKCSLRVAAPTVTTLACLCNAAAKLSTNLNTIGVDVQANAFFAVKSASDMEMLLAEMDSTIGTHKTLGVAPTAAAGPLTVHTLSYPKGVFRGPGTDTAMWQSP